MLYSCKENKAITLKENTSPQRDKPDNKFLKTP